MTVLCGRNMELYENEVPLYINISYAIERTAQVKRIIYTIDII
jgi:hypothetical protein